MTMTRTCPSPEAPKVGEFSATPTSLTLFLPNDVGQIASFVYAP